MIRGTRAAGVAAAREDAATLRRERRLEGSIGRLPKRVQSTMRWLRRPSSRWVRLPVGVLLVCGGLLGFLPLLGFWMLPLGLVLLAEDLPPFRRVRDAVLDWIERRRPHWIATRTPIAPSGPSAAHHPVDRRRQARHAGRASQFCLSRRRRDAI
jgi:hypothetical protein